MVSNNHNPIRWSLIIIFAGVCAIIMVIASLIFFDDRIVIYTEFSNVDGLRSGAEVQLCGIKAGKVQSIFFSNSTLPNSNAPIIKVQLLLDKKIGNQPIQFILYKNSSALLRSDGSLDTRIIDIQQGTPQSGNIQNGDYITGKVETNLKDLLQHSNEFTLNLDTARAKFDEIGKNIKAGQGSLGAFLYRTTLQESLSQLGHEVDKLSHNLNYSSGSIAKFKNKKFKSRIQNLNKIIKDFEKDFAQRKNWLKSTKPKEFIEAVNQLSNHLQQLESKLDQLKIRQRKEFSKSSILVIRLKEFLENSKNISANIENKEGTLSKLLYDYRLKKNIENILSEASKILYEMHQHPFRFVKLQFRLF